MKTGKGFSHRKLLLGSVAIALRAGCLLAVFTTQAWAGVGPMRPVAIDFDPIRGSNANRKAVHTRVRVTPTRAEVVRIEVAPTIFRGSDPVFSQPNRRQKIAVPLLPDGDKRAAQRWKAKVPSASFRLTLPAGLSDGVYRQRVDVIVDFNDGSETYTTRGERFFRARSGQYDDITRGDYSNAVENISVWVNSDGTTYEVANGTVAPRSTAPDPTGMDEVVDIDLSTSDGDMSETHED